MTRGTILFFEAMIVSTGLVLWWLAIRHKRARPWLDGPDRLGKWPIAVSDFILGALLVFTFSQLAPLLAAHLAGFDLGGAENSAKLFLAFATQAGWLVAWLLFRLHPAGRPPREDAPMPPALRAGGLALFYLLPPMYALNYAWMFALEAAGFEIQPQDFVEIIRTIDSMTGAALWIFATIVIAPIVEELVFRGMLYRFLSAHIRTVPAAIVSGVLFASLHWNLAVFVPLTLLGIALALLYEKTGRILAAIVLHALFNGHSLMGLFFGD